ncbi:PREDICTED: complement component C9 [Elephantulus edwardii]|uniref:complement component C9 n=1 Tax=Elephantulus edwardii TaxID=28737 RepID=UPI0003F0CAD0|nr:PREDICTED: complement component C9 [Elephantulus edwardii]
MWPGWWSAFVICILQIKLLAAGPTPSYALEPVQENGTPSPVDCRMSPWSEWSQCYPCLKQQFRSRSIEAFGQFNGEACHNSVGDRQHCSPAGPCEEAEDDCRSGFRCDTGRCINLKLQCNGDNDCGDFSDEDNCDNDPRPPCRDRQAEESEMARTAGYGINILGMDPLSTPFDNEFFNGFCDRVRDGNTLTYYRKPWNVAYLGFDVKADKHFRTEHFEEQTQAFQSIIQEKTSTFKAEISLKFVPTETFKEYKSALGLSPTGGPIPNPIDITAGSSFTYFKKEAYQQFLSYFSKKEKMFLHVKGEIQTGKFVMRNRNVMLTMTFVDDIKALPINYEKGEYYAFLETYGTHYSSSGSLGGLYELIYVLDKTAMKKKGIELKDVQRCVGFNAQFSVDVAIFGTELKGNVDSNDCLKRGEGGIVNITSDNIIDDVISFIRGGTRKHALQIKEKLARGAKTIDVADFVNWAGSLNDAPVLINQKLSPIYNLVPVDMKDSYQKKQNLERSIEEYINEFNVKKCHPCQNGGTVILMDGRCVCSCPIGTEGIACEFNKLRIS